MTKPSSSTKCRLAASVAVALLTLPGCASDTGGGGAGAQAQSLEDCTVTLIPKNTDNPYFASVNFGAAEAAEELGGGPVDYVGTAAPDVPGQIQRVQSASQRGSCAIAISALDAEAASPALSTAADTGAKIVSYDADVLPEARDLFIDAADPVVLGVTQLELLAEALDYQGEFAIVSAQSTAQNQNAWLAAIEEELTEPEYAEMTLVRTVYGDDDSQRSYDQSVSVYQGYPELDGILALTPVALAAAVKARSDLGVDPATVVTGLGWPPSDGALLKDGQVPAFVLWSPVDLGYVTYHATAALINGDITGAEGDTFEAGRLGELTVGADGVVVLGDPLVLTAENVDASLSEFQTE